ncbi:MAG: class I SAM-dependent methyltransferase [Proteobacteria bacterium]|nr:class I SAM-dependent methyltransferase [Pseudomonadota bacterium]
MRHLLVACASALVLSSAAFMAAGAAPKAPAYVAHALADKGRPEADTKLDEARKPGELLAFSGLKPGDKIADIMPGRGYFSRLFADVVGPKGHVFLWVPKEQDAISKGTALQGANAFAATFKNVSVVSAPINDFSTPEKLDMAWLTLNYHDWHDPFMGPADIAKVNKAVFNSLKPGGVFFVVDHVAEAGSGARDTDTLHRIDPALVKKEVEAAGFKLEAVSDVLRNPEDDHTKKVFDASIRRHTDQFVFKFRKPRR